MNVHNVCKKELAQFLFWQVYRASVGAIEHYDFERYGYKNASSIAPTLNLGAEPELGARIAIPVESIK